MEQGIGLEEYYKNPIMESWTYVNIGMDNLKDCDPNTYRKIEEKRALLLLETQERLKYIRQVSGALGLDYPEVEFYIGQFLQKFPMAIRTDVGWDDPAFIFLYLLTRIVKPKVIIESGSNVGFSSSFIALAVKENNNNCRFYTIEPCSDYDWESLSFIEHNNVRKQEINYSKLIGKCGPLAVVPQDLRELIILKRGYSKDILPDLLKENGRVDIFFHDSDHGYRNMVWECATALPHIPIGGYILVHDIRLNSAFQEMFGRKGGIAIKEDLGAYKKTEKDFVIDKEWVPSFDNSRLNDNEYKSGKIKLESSPKNIVIRINNACNLNCVFCSGRKNNEEFNFDNFYRKLESRISRYLSQAEKIIFEACGGFFNSSEIEKMISKRINCIELSFPEVEKIYFSNGFDLTPEAADFIVNPRGTCTEYAIKNTVNVLLYASNSYLYKILTRSDDFPLILNRLERLIKLRNNNSSNLKVHLTFIATTLNIEDMPDFVKLTSDIGADKVICSYAYIHVPAQKYLSCFFKQERTNDALNKAETLAKQLKIEVILPPKFNQREYRQSSPCLRAWDEMTIDAKGDILVCQTGIECNENLRDQDFMDIWNGPYYQALRKSLLEGSRECFKYCVKANPACVNDFRSHVINCGGKDSELNILWGDNF